MGDSQQRAFQRAKFDPLGKKLSKDDNIRSLPDLIDFNAQVNPGHIFCVQASAKTTSKPEGGLDGTYGSDRINFKGLKHAVDACSYWLEQNVVTYEELDGTRAGPSPVALYLESDVSLFIYVAALLALGVPVVLLSARLSAESVRHLLSETNTRSMLVSKRTERLMAQDVVDIAETKLAPNFLVFLKSSTVSHGPPRSSSNDGDALILHSSGTTGHPKPIRLAHRYILGYAACHSFPADEDVSWPNLSTLPLYHGFGLLAPCLSLSIGMPCILPPHSTIPDAHSTVELLSTFGAQSLMTVPSILEDMLFLAGEARENAISLLRRLRLVAVGGGPLSPNARDNVIAEGVKLVNHYGATEIGAIAPIFQPGTDYDARYLRLRNDLGLQLHPVMGTEEPQRFKLVGYPFGWGGRAFEIQDELIKKPDSSSAHVEVQILGRSDDLVVLSNGEKVIPRHLEQALVQDSSIKTAVCLGQGKFELTVLVEPTSSTKDVPEFVEHVWQLLSEQINPSLDAHARISSRQAIIVKSPGKTIPRSDKGSIMRSQVHAIFDEEIRAAYEALELESFSTSVPFDVERLESSIWELVDKVMSERLRSGWQTDEDLFELGMDSLQATRLARFLNSAIESAFPGVFDVNPRLKPAFIYQNPSLAQLSSAVGRLVGRKSAESVDRTKDRASRMRALVDEYVNTLDNDEEVLIADGSLGKRNRPGAVVLLTGSTGNLGAHMLSCLAQSDRVSNVICLHRHTFRDSSEDGLRARQEDVNASAGVALSPDEWKKVSFVAANTQASDLGMSRSELAQLATVVTHVVHLAWPMDFNRQLASFRPQLNMLQTLIRLLRFAHKARPHAEPPRLLLASSISVVRHHREHTTSNVVPETSLENPLVTAEMGYAEAKWVCERVLQLAANGDERYTPLIVRIGQLSGPERAAGIWKTEEHVPALLKASQMLSAFPYLKGDFSWLPVDRAARSLVDILFYGDAAKSAYYHLENPIRQPLSALGAFVVEELGLKEGCIPFEAWLERMAATGHAASLVDFFKNNFQALASGNVVLDTRATRMASIHLRGSGGLSRNLIVEYVRRWRRSGYLA
ncbi:putative NRPS-like enzyme [Ophiobolus disseminans]|uniref:NRPS-like enzyme n=1 Tax=Ophiobolus disseminans TaxID=1469910 RepID=A0A6A6ZF16_9PLEO|nr:putative NRPS-like enzyme [Ophiobolus disseminans]